MKLWVAAAVACIGLVACGGVKGSAQSSSSALSSSEVVAVASFDGSSGHGAAPDVEDFDGTASYTQDPDAWIAAFHWDFGDGQSSNDGWVEHTYSAAGTYTVTLTATDSNGATGTAQLTVTVDSGTSTPPPTSDSVVVAVAQFDGSDGHGAAPDVEDFDGTASYSNDPSVWIDRCHWDFGDGTSADDCWVEHTYAVGGSFTATLTVYGSNGDTAQATLAVEVGPQGVAPGSTRWVKETNSGHIGSDKGASLGLVYNRGEADFFDPDGNELRATTLGPDFGLDACTVSPTNGAIYASGEEWRDGAWQPMVIKIPRDGSTDTVLEAHPGGRMTRPASNASGEIAWVDVGDDSEMIQYRKDTVGGGIGLWLKSQGTSALNPSAIAVDDDGNFIVAGLPAGPYEYGGRVFPANQATLLKISPDGALLWGRSLGCWGEINAIDTSAAGTVVVGGGGFTGTCQWGSTTFDQDGPELFIAEADGTLRWAMHLGNIPGAMSLAVVPSGEVVVVTLPSSGRMEVRKWNLAGSLLWDRLFEPPNGEVFPWDVAVLGHDAVVSGYYSGTVDFGTGPHQKAQGTQGFLLELNP